MEEMETKAPPSKKENTLRPLMNVKEESVSNLDKQEI